MKINKYRNFVPAIILVSVLLIIWQIVVQYNYVSSTILPSPTNIVQVFFMYWDIILMHSWQTLLEASLGLLIALVLGLSIAIALDMSSWIRKAIYPLLITSQTIPMIAMAPLLLIWFGYGLLPKVIIVILSCFFPIAIATSDGFAKTDHDLTKLLKSMHASYWQQLRLVRLPGAMPQFFSGLKIAATYSVTGAIVGEYVGAYQGLGIYMQEMAHSFAIALVFAAIIMTGVLTIFLFLLIVFIEKKTLSWHQK